MVPAHNKSTDLLFTRPKVIYCNFPYRVLGYTAELTSATPTDTVAAENIQMMEKSSACCLGCVSLLQMLFDAPAFSSDSGVSGVIKGKAPTPH